MDLQKLVRDKIAALGVKDAARYFGISLGTASNWSSGKTCPSVDAVQMLLEESGLLQAPKQELAMWEGRKVHIGLPVYRYFSADTHYTLFANYAKYGAEKVGMTMEKRTLIYEARSILTHKFLHKTDAEWLVMADDDMVIPPGNAGIMNGNYKANMPEPSASLVGLSRLMSHPWDKKIVGSLYFGRHANGLAQNWMGFNQVHENDNLRKHVYNHLMPMEWVGTGFIRVHRSVFETMRNEIDKGRWPECKPKNETLWYGFWHPIQVGVGEDVSFGRRCSEIGIQSYLDPVLECLHIGDNPYHGRNTSNA